MMSRKSKHRVGEMHAEDHHLRGDHADAGDDGDDDDHHPLARKGSFAVESFLRRQHAAPSSKACAKSRCWCEVRGRAEKPPSALFRSQAWKSR